MFLKLLFLYVHKSFLKTKTDYMLYKFMFDVKVNQVGLKYIFNKSEYFSKSQL